MKTILKPILKPILKNINGILLIDKPLKLTSNGALQYVKRLYNAKKAGHTGSLDPLATGMLPICFGEATKVSQFLLDSDKYYQVQVKLGITTTTGDAEGEVVETKPVVDITIEKIKTVVEQFVGAIQQIPPMFSAIKFQGQPLYKMARQGIEIDRKPRAVFIHSLRVISFENETIVLDVHCSKGTYIRTLAQDIGDNLGCGAYTIGLLRTAVSPYEQNKMYGLAQLEDILAQKGFEGLMACLLPLDTSVQHLPEIKLSSSASFYIRMGQAVTAPNLPANGWVRIFSENNQFMGIGEILKDGRVAPRRLVNFTKKMAS